MRRYRIAPGRYVPTDPNGKPSLCQCKPWQLCTACGLYEHLGGLCSWCRSTTTLEMLRSRPDLSQRAARAATVARRANAQAQTTREVPM